MNADLVLDKVGAFGFYQKRLLFVLWITAVINSWPLLSVIFTHYVPGYHCSVGYDANSSAMVVDVNETTLLYNNQDIPSDPCVSSFNDSSNQTASCTDWEFSTENDGGETVVSEMSLVCDKEWILPLIVSISMAARAVGLMVSGPLTDRFGRRTVYLGSSIVVFATTLYMAFSKEIIGYGISLILSGTFSSIQYSVLCVLGSEMLSPKYRQLALLCILSGYIFGYATMPLLAYLSNDWHTVLYCVCIGNCIFAAGYWYFPETVHWLIMKKEWKKTQKLITEIARINNCPFGINNLLENNDFENFMEVENEEKQPTNTKESTTRFLTNPTMLLRLSVSMSIWFTTSFVYYAILLNTSFLQGDRYVNCVISALLEIPSLALGHFLMGKIGRIRTNFIFFIVSGLTLISARLFSGMSPVAVTAFAIGGKTAITGAFYVIYVHAVEISPTSNRGLFLNVCSASSSVGAALSPCIMYLGRTDTSETIVYMFMGICSVLAGVWTVIFLPETIGKPLPDTTEEAINQKTLRFCGRKNNDSKP